MADSAPSRRRRVMRTRTSTATWAATTSARTTPDPGMTTQAAAVGTSAATGVGAEAETAGPSASASRAASVRTGAAHGRRDGIVELLHAVRDVLHHTVQEESRGRAQMAAPAAFHVLSHFLQ